MCDRQSQVSGRLHSLSPGQDAPSPHTGAQKRELASRSKKQVRGSKPQQMPPVLSWKGALSPSSPPSHPAWGTPSELLGVWGCGSTHVAPRMGAHPFPGSRSCLPLGRLTLLRGAGSPSVLNTIHHSMIFMVSRSPLPVLPTLSELNARPSMSYNRCPEVVIVCCIRNLRERGCLPCGEAVGHGASATGTGHSHCMWPPAPQGPASSTCFLMLYPHHPTQGGTKPRKERGQLHSSSPCVSVFLPSVCGQGPSCGKAQPVSP